MKLLLVSHKGLASGMLTAAKFVAGDIAEADVLEMGDAGLLEFQKELDTLIQTYSKDIPILLVSDIPAGSAGNTAFAKLKTCGFDITYVSGMNLAFLLEFLLSGDLAQALNSGHAALQIMGADGQIDDEDF